MSFASVRRYIVVRVGGLEAQIPLSTCYWCGEQEQHICTLCYSRAERARASLARTVAKRDARIGGAA